MFNVLPFIAALLLGAVDPFEAVQAKATAVESLPKLLEAYAAKCNAPDPMDAQECAQRAKAARSTFHGKTLYAHLGSGFENLMEAQDAPAGKGLVLLTPVVDVGSQVALTFTKPQKLSPQGTIVVPRYPVSGALLDDSLLPTDVKRLVKTGGLNVEIVFTVVGSWQLKRTDGGLVDGVAVNVTALRLSNRRNGRAILSQVK